MRYLLLYDIGESFILIPSLSVPTWTWFYLVAIFGPAIHPLVGSNPKRTWRFLGRVTDVDTRSTEVTLEGLCSPLTYLTLMQRWSR